MLKKFCLMLAFALLAINVFARNVKVLISEDKNNVAIAASAPFQVKNLDNNKSYKIKESGIFNIKKEKGQITCGNLKSKKGFVLTLSKNGANFELNKNKYNGILEILPSKNGVNIIENLDLENYLLGVLPYEMSYAWPVEALKAQAVAARTYTLKSIEDKKLGDFDLYSDIRSQMYKGSFTVYDSVKQAVEETKGQVLTYKGQKFYTYYHANCGGHTDPVPWLKDPIKPLSGNTCGYCQNAKTYTWKATLNKNTVQKFLEKNKIAGTFKKIKIGKKFPSGRAKTLILITNKTKQEVSCNDFRIGVGSTVMKSCFLTSINGLKLEGRGYGHGGGMCQEGAKGMALDGKKYKDILKRYYPGSDITKI